MKTFGLGMRGLTRGCMPIWCGRRSPLRRLHGAQEATMFSQSDAAALGARDDVVDRQARARAAVLALPAVAGEHRAAGDLALVRVARDPHVGDEADDDRLGHRPVDPVQVVLADLHHLGLGLQEQHRGAAHRADVDRLVRRVEDEHAATRPTAGAVGIRSVPPVVVERHGPQWCWGYAHRRPRVYPRFPREPPFPRPARVPSSSAAARRSRGSASGAHGSRRRPGTNRARARPRSGPRRPSIGAGDRRFRASPRRSQKNM